MIFLNVPFDEKEAAKTLGAKWHVKKKKWFIPEDVDKSLFNKWLPDYETEFSMKAISPFYLVKSKQLCWKCGQLSDVITFAAEGIVEEGEDNNGFVTFVYVSLLPEKLTRFVSEKYDNYFIDFSNTTQSYYYINHCQYCSASLGDFYMHSEPEGDFFPISEQTAKEIELVELKAFGYIQLNGEPSYSSPSMIEEYANKKKYKP